MGWSEWPSWLKGGIVLALIDFIILIVPIIRYLGNQTLYSESFGYLLFFTNPLSFIISDLFEIRFLGPLGYAFFGIIIYFIIGAIIGWLVGKIRNR